MAYNGKILGRANARLSSIREKNTAEHERRQNEVYSRIPEIRHIDARLRSQMFELTKLILSGRSSQQSDIEELKNRNLDFQMRKAELLTEKGYPVSWLDDIYSCELCHDTGYDAHGSPCSCLKKYYNLELTTELSTLLHSGDECFEKFNLQLYPGEYSSYYSCIPREYMNKVFELCKQYAKGFPNVTTGLLFIGGPGLGKTYLSACIARVVAEAGYSVCYDSAVSAFQIFERQQFSRSPEEQENSAEKVKNFLSCDLLILDDLGTEIVTPAVQSALYTYINTRENRGLHTIISTALTKDDIGNRYSDSICSRLNGNFQTVPFAGNDIRQILKNHSV